MCEGEKDDVEFCGSRNFDMAGFGEGKILSLSRF